MPCRGYDNQKAVGDTDPTLIETVRAEGGQNYRVLSSVWIPQGLSGAAVPPGGQSSGKVYFDVVGPDPNSVVYSDGVQDLLVWVP